MKPVAFDFVRPDTLGAAAAALGRPGAKAVAGNQSLGPMLNLRLAKPAALVDVTRIPDLQGAHETADAVIYGGALRHADFEDGRVPDVAGGALARVARDIAYRAVRNRGTLGGSLVHADPAADWVTVFSALGAEVELAGVSGGRRVRLADFIVGAFETSIRPDEVLVRVHVSRPSPDARLGYLKFCRRVGELADAMCAVFVDPPKNVCRLVIGAMDGRPVIVEDASALLADPAGLDRLLAPRKLDAVKARLQRTIVRRVIADVGGRT